MSAYKPPKAIIYPFIIGGAVLLLGFLALFAFEHFYGDEFREKKLAELKTGLKTGVDGAVDREYVDTVVDAYMSALAAGTVEQQHFLDLNWVTGNAMQGDGFSRDEALTVLASMREVTDTSSVASTADLPRPQTATAPVESSADSLNQ